LSSLPAIQDCECLEQFSLVKVLAEFPLQRASKERIRRSENRMLKGGAIGKSKKFPSVQADSLYHVPPTL